MKLLELLRNPDGDLPFATSVNEATVLQCLLEMHHTERTDIAGTLKQWMRFNKGLNTYECDEYQTWVSQIYGHIEELIQTTDTKN